MSNEFVGVTFPWQKVSPSDDGSIRRAILTDGILEGCGFSYAGSTLTMDAGSLLVCGRKINHPSAQNWAVADATSGYARLLLTVDLTQTSTKEVFNQVTASIEYATAANGFVDLEQTDINTSGTKYQIVLCVVSLTAAGISGVTQQIGKAITNHASSTNNPHGVTAEQVGAVALEALKNLAYSQTDANGKTTAALISSYPTAPGVYRVGSGSSLGIPGDWGTLIIFNSGGFIAHVFVNGSGMWFSRTDGTYTVTAWNRVQDWLFSDANGTFIDKYGRNWNPEFVFGTEYITEERWNNSGVYKKWLNLGKLGTAGSTISVAHGITRTWIIGIRGIAVKNGGTAMEMVNGCGNGSVFVQDDKLQWHCILDLSSYNGYVEITYTKV